MRLDYDAIYMHDPRMSTATQSTFVQDAWQTPRNARTLRAYMALRNQEIASRIKELRERRHMSQVDLAHALGVAERTEQSWEGGEAIPGYRSLQKLAAYFSVTEGYILEGVDERPIIEGVPEQLDGVDEKFTERVDDVERAISDIAAQLHAFQDWSKRAVEQIIDERDLALARANERLVSIEGKLDRLMHMVDAGLFTPRADGASREDQLGLGAALAAAFDANPNAKQALLDTLRGLQAQERTGS